MKSVAENREAFVEAYGSAIHREGSDRLLSWLEGSDFFSSPASTKFHGAYEGGLCEHSLHVYNRLVELIDQERILLAGAPSGIFAVSRESLAICGLLHDVCKIGIYRPRLVNGEQTWSFWDDCPLGHGEKSLWLIERYIHLSAEEALAIRWHMGAFDDSVKGGFRNLGHVYEEFPLALFLHIADMQASYLDERR